ncbi:TIGR02391 family protein [Antarcticimicrobium sediminis]|uniref:TIGR02391 family protein n=1 Tax=Antarcticimicrobium sediminis TaxID=2546227 RepID=UPI0014051928|nr:TIGR02391 family protein [Antarcticimicrobium sediminis]
MNKDLLHPAIAEKVWLAFVRGDFAEAVFTAMCTVEVAVREAGGLAQKQVGTKLMQAAFGQGGPLRDPEANAAEQDRLMHLFIGAMGSYKNPYSHRNVALEDAGEATEIVTLARHLLRIVDARRPALQERQTDEA